MTRKFYLSSSIHTIFLVLLLSYNYAVCCHAFSSRRLVQQLPQDMIVLVTGRRVLMLHGDGGGVKGGADTTSRRRHTYGVVEWEVDFRLVVWLEIGSGGGGAEPHPPAPSRKPRARDGSGDGVSRGSEESTLFIYHFPDLAAEPSGKWGAGTLCVCVCVFLASLFGKRTKISGVGSCALAP